MIYGSAQRSFRYENLQFVVAKDSLANVDYCSRVTACTEEQRAMVRHSIVFSVSVLDPVLNLNRNPLILSAKYRFFGDKGF